MVGWQYIALLGAVIAIFAFIMPKQSKPTSLRIKSNDEIEQIELSLGQFMDNMEKQHDELVQVLSASINQLKEENRQKSDIITSLEKKSLMLEEQIAMLSHAYVALETKLQFLSPTDDKSKSSTTTSITSATLTKPEPDDTVSKENSIHNRYAELFSLYEAGKSIEFIAKKFGKNKGEVQLIIQLAKQEEKIQHG